MRDVKFLILFIICGCLSSNNHAQVQLWPDSLEENANLITVFDNTLFTIFDTDKSSFKRHYKVAILNKYARSGRNIYVSYSKFSTIKNGRVIVTNEFGDKIASFNLKDFNDINDNFGNTSVASDSRYKSLKINYDEYPFFIDVEYERVNESSLHYPRWEPIAVENQSVSKASFKIIASSKDDFRYYSENLDNPKIYNIEGKFIAEWSVADIKAFKYEVLSPNIYDKDPVLFIAPNSFEIDNYDGNMDTWQSMGDWINKLNSSRNNLSKERYTELAKIAEKYNNNEEKIKAVYRYLQNNFRYVSVQLGVGGWQPFETKFVDEKKYGDCKALTFYTKNILNYIGIPAYYTLILAGEGELDVPESFPISMFNHAFLTVPNEGDTIFLECTSQTNPFGYLGTFTSDRNALMVTENGGKLIRTKAYNHSDNIESTKSEIQIDEHGDSDVLISKTYRALEIPEYLEYHYTSNETKENQKKWCYDNFDWGNLSITNLEISPITYERIPNAGFVLEGMISKDAKKTGSRLFYSPIKFANINYIKLPDKERKQSIEIKYPFSQIDSIKIDFPNNYIMETNYDDKELKNKYGYYSREKVMTNEGINVIRKFVLHKGLYPKEEYVDFRGFIRSIQKLDKQRIVLVKE